MPKHGWLTPKAIANRIKAKGLQKLRWYCQMCQKQCRDENGFKCHMMSESHQRQLLLVADNPGKYIYSFSQEFLHDFMELLSRQYGTRRVHCNEVYQQYIKDKNHFHMNATRWVTLTGFVQWLGRQGLCVVDQTPKGWFIKYIDRSPAAMARQAAAQKKERMDKSDEEITQKFIEQQIARALANKKDDDDDDDDDDTVPYTELQRTDEEEKVVFRLSKEPQPTTSGTASGTKEPTREIADTTTSSASSDGEPESSVDLPEMQLETAVGGFTQKKKPPEKVQLVPNAFKSATATVPAKKKLSKQEGTRKRKLTTLEEIRMMEEERKEKRNRRDNWLAEGIVVKVLHKQLGERYYKKKGVVEEVRDLFTAVVRMMDSGDKIKIDQALLETVIPAIGKPVLVVNGAYRGLRAILETLDTDNFCVSVRIDQGPARDRLVERVPYEDISKLALDLDT